MKIHYLLPLAVTCLFIGCEAEKDVRTFDELRFASMMAGGDNDEGGTNITLTTCHVAGPLETSVIFEVKSVPVIRYGSLDCKVIDEFAAPVTEVNVSLLATISGDNCPPHYAWFHSRVSPRTTLNLGTPSWECSGSRGILGS